MGNQKCWHETCWQSPFSCLTSITSYAPQNGSGLFTIHHSLSEKLKKEGKKRRNFRWSHVRLDSCAAHFRMEQAHLFSCWLPVLKSPEDRSTVRTHAAPSVSYYRVLLSTSHSFILLDKKWQTHFFVHDVFRFICQLVEENLTPGQGADSRGTFGRRKEQLMNGFKWKVLVRA